MIATIASQPIVFMDNSKSFMQPKLFIMLILILITVLFIRTFYRKPQYEHFYNYTPYSYHWDIFKCLSGPCVRKKGRECYDWCTDNLVDEGNQEQCRTECLNYSDLMYQELKLDNYTFDRLLPRFEQVSLLNNTDYAD
jgi:hypothetical protein